MEAETPKQGSITLYTGCMYSGKSEELLGKLNRVRYQKGISAAAFRPRIKNLSRVIRARSFRFRVTSTLVDPKKPEKIIQLANEADIVAIDEAQFFEKSLNKIVTELYLTGKKVYLTGLDTTYEGEPWPIITEIKKLPEVKIRNKYAVCSVCGDQATRTFKKKDAPPELVLVGDGDIYEARCLHCWLVGQKESK